MISDQGVRDLLAHFRSMVAPVSVNQDQLAGARAGLDQLIMALRAGGLSDLVIGAYCMSVLVQNRTADDALLRVLLVDGFK